MFLHQFICTIPKEQALPMASMLERVQEISCVSVIPMLLNMQSAGRLELEHERFAALARQLGSNIFIYIYIHDVLIQPTKHLFLICLKILCIPSWRQNLFSMLYFILFS